MNDPPSLGALMATSVSGQAIGGALALIWLVYHPVTAPGSGITPQELQDALTIIFSTLASLACMIIHVITVLLLNRLQPKT